MKIIKNFLKIIDAIRAYFFIVRYRLINLMSLLKEGRYRFIVQRLAELLLYNRSLSVFNPSVNLVCHTCLGGKPNYETIVFPEAGNPLVSIIIPIYNQWNFTYGCLKSIYENTSDIYYEIIIADDASTDETVNIERIVKNIKIIHNKNNVGFLKNCNISATKARGKYIVLLNNDTNVQADWLKYLLQIMETNTKAGLVGSKLVYPTGLLQEAGGIIWRNATGINYGHSCHPLNPEYNYVKEVDYISGAAIMVRSKLWNRIGGFDERFSPAYYEDTDLAFEIRKHGFKVIYQPASVVVHFEGISHGTDVADGVKSFQIKNRIKFLDKWEDFLQQHCENDKNIFLARDRKQFQKTMLFIDHDIPTYDKDAGSRATFQYLQFFVKKKMNVKFFCDDIGLSPSSPYLRLLQQSGIEVLYGTRYARYWKTWLKINNQYIDYVVLSRPHIAKKYIGYIKTFSHIKIIYFGHDLHYLRTLREYELIKKKRLQRASKDFKKLELSIMRQVDIACFFSKEECDELNRLAPEIPTRKIPLNIFEKFLNIDYGSTQRNDILFVGGFNHLPNQDGILWFINEVFPFLKAKEMDCTLYVVGSNPPSKIMELANKNIVVTGYVTDSELKDFYARCKLVIAPLRFGAGVKGKIVEALYYGLPVVTTSIGAEGFVNVEDVMKITDEPNLFSDYIIAIYQNETLASELSKKGIQYCKRHFSSKNVLNSFPEIFREDKCSETE